MRRLVLIGALLAVMPVLRGDAASYAAFEQITVAGTAIGFTAAKIQPTDGRPQATTATCRVRTAEISVTWDGTTPTSTVGTLLEIGDWIQLTDPGLMTTFRAIRTGSSGQLDCHYTNP